MRTWTILLAFAGLSVPDVVPLAAQAHEPGFAETVEVTEVLLDVLVTDKKGSVILGLGPDDRMQVASVLNEPEEKLFVELVPNGGAFGGKEDMSIQAHTALLAHHTGRPVRITLNREESIRVAQITLLGLDPDARHVIRFDGREVRDRGQPEPDREAAPQRETDQDRSELDQQGRRPRRRSEH